MNILSYWQGFYNDPWFWMFPMATLAISLIAFLSVATPWTIVAWLDPASLRKYKIQQKPFEFKQFFWPSIIRIIINNIILVGLLIVAWPLMKQTGVHAQEVPVWYVIIAQLLFFVLFDDFLYYWMHRAMHSRWLLVNVHSVHHRIKNTCALDGNYFHWIEFAATASLALVAPIILGAHLYVLWIWIIIRQFEAADGHCGYDLPYNPVKLIPFYHGAVYHDFHHARFKGNYAGFLSYLDGFMGNTYVPQYLKYIAAKRLNKNSQKASSQNI